MTKIQPAPDGPKPRYRLSRSQSIVSDRTFLVEVDGQPFARAIREQNSERWGYRFDLLPDSIGIITDYDYSTPEDAVAALLCSLGEKLRRLAGLRPLNCPYPILAGKLEDMGLDDESVVAQMMAYIYHQE